MKAIPAPMTVVSFCSNIGEKSIVVNRDYQRNENVWTAYQRSYFIESILLQYPIPKIFLYAKYDVKNRTSVKEIVDGQQRTQAMLLFFRNKLILSKKLDSEQFRGKRYSTLDPSDQEKFLSYLLSIDEFSAVSEDEVRESFTRMNQHTVTLNPEELRHAYHRGEMKHAVLDVAKSYRDIFIESGILSRRDIIRMADTRVVSEMFFTLIHGFHTHKPKDLDGMYSEFEEEFSERASLSELISEAIDWWHSNYSEFLDKMKSKHIFYMLIVASCEILRPGIVTSHLSGDDMSEIDRLIEQKFNIEDLEADLAISRARNEDDAAESASEDDATPGVDLIVDDPERSDDGLDVLGAGAIEPRFAEFVEACRSGTNVERSKKERFKFLYAALRS